MRPSERNGTDSGLDALLDSIVEGASRNLRFIADGLGAEAPQENRLPALHIEMKDAHRDPHATGHRRADPRHAGRTCSVPVHPGAISWHELRAHDPAEAAFSLASLLDLEVVCRSRGHLDEYRALTCGGLHVAGVRGCHEALDQGWSTYVRVANVEHACDRAIALGGAVRIAPSGIMGLDRRAEISDPTGACITVIAGGDDRRTVGAGAFGWDELRTVDPTTSGRFWCEIFGWSAMPLASPRGSHAALFLNGGRAVASMQRTSASEARSRWMPVATVRTDTVRNAISRAVSSGYRIEQAPVPHAVLSLEAVLVDPNGIEIALGCEPMHGVAAA